MSNILAKKTVGNLLILSIDGDPTQDLGVNAPQGSIAMSTNGSSYEKIGITNTDWVNLSTDDFNNVILNEVSSIPETPTEGGVIFSKNVARQMLGFKDKSGINYSVQPHFGQMKIISIEANPGLGSVSVLGCGTPSTYGTYNTGGFHFVARAGVGDAVEVPDARMFIGFCSNFSPLSGNPSDFSNSIGFGNDPTDVNLQVFSQDSLGGKNKIDLGSSFPANTRSTDMYEFILFCPPNADYINWRIVNLTTGVNANGVITTNLPLPTPTLVMHLWRNNNSTALIETQF